MVAMLKFKKEQYLPMGLIQVQTNNYDFDLVWPCTRYNDFPTEGAIADRAGIETQIQNMRTSEANIWRMVNKILWNELLLWRAHMVRPDTLVSVFGNGY